MTKKDSDGFQGGIWPEERVHRMKLRSENTMQKKKLKSPTMEQKSSVNSDCTGRYSMRSRKTSLTSVGSVSTIETLNRRRGSESEISSTQYVPRSSHFEYGLQESSSQTNFEKDRRITELERQLKSLHADIDLEERELKLYKISLRNLETEREQIITENRSLLSEIDSLRLQNSTAEKKIAVLTIRLTRALEDAERWEKRHENLINEAKDDILTERIRGQGRVEAVRAEFDGHQERYHRMELTRDELQEKLSRCETELGKALSNIRDLEKNAHCEERLRGGLEVSQLELFSELQNVKDENRMLQSRIRQQGEQIKLLNQQDSTNDMMNHINGKVSL